MRDDLDRALTALAECDESVVIVVADLGRFRIFRSRFPERFFNVGVAETNSVGVAAGMASQGKRVFLFSVAGFTLYRAFEQIKFSIGFWKQPVCIFGTGFGWRYHRIGRGHHAGDDVALMQLVPNMRIMTPATGASLPAMLAAAATGPCYVRLGEGVDWARLPVVPERGKDGVVVALGEVKWRCVEPVLRLRSRGVDVGLLAVEYFSLEEVGGRLLGSGERARVVVVEDHVLLGGLGDLVRRLGVSVAAHIHLPVAVDAVCVSEDELAANLGFSNDALERSFTAALG